jgi:cyclopropane fatty-acyl-phospholipid synthase-like methyltransferase
MLAQHGWQASGIDFASRAIAKGRRKARKAGVQINFKTADVSKPLPFDPPVDLILDIGCLHSLPVSLRLGYYSNLFRLLSDNGHYLLYAFTKTDNGRPGLSINEISYLSERLNLLNRQDGEDTAAGRRSAWFTFQGKRRS